MQQIDKWVIAGFLMGLIWSCLAIGVQIAWRRSARRRHQRIPPALEMRFFGKFCVIFAILSTVKVAFGRGQISDCYLLLCFGLSALIGAWAVSLTLKLRGDNRWV